MDLSKFLSGLRDPTNYKVARTVALLVWTFDAILSVTIVLKVPYTEIDWVAYMEQAALFLGGERDYTRIEGGTGPVVYPASHIYAYAALHRLTGGGQIWIGQWIFVGVYLVSLAAILSLYVRAGVLEPWQLPLLVLSKRLHSIYMLRMFNDCLAMLLSYAALSLLSSRRVPLSILLFSAATSIKMNVLLMAPPVLALCLRQGSMGEVAAGVAAGVGLQLGLGYPFLTTYPKEYLGRAFEFSRVFLYKWTVNLRFLPEEAFVSKPLALGLLGAHLGLLALFAAHRWFGPEGFASVWSGFLRRSFGEGSKAKKGSQGKKWGPEEDREWRLTVLRTVWTGNFIGILCARSLHYQFYSWYCWSVPALLWATPFPLALRLGLWAAIEVVWNLYPPSPAASLALLGSHLVLLVGLWLGPRDGAGAGDKAERKGARAGGRKAGPAAGARGKKRE